MPRTIPLDTAMTDRMRELVKTYQNVIQQAQSREDVETLNQIMGPMFMDELKWRRPLTIPESAKPEHLRLLMPETDELIRRKFITNENTIPLVLPPGLTEKDIHRAADDLIRMGYPKHEIEEAVGEFEKRLKKRPTLEMKTETPKTVRTVQILNPDNAKVKWTYEPAQSGSAVAQAQPAFQEAVSTPEASGTAATKSIVPDQWKYQLAVGLGIGILVAAGHYLLTKADEKTKRKNPATSALIGLLAGVAAGLGYPYIAGLFSAK